MKVKYSRPNDNRVNLGDKDFAEKWLVVGEEYEVVNCLGGYGGLPDEIMFKVAVDDRYKWFNAYLFEEVK